MKKRNVAILGAAGRDYHNFLVCFKDNPIYEVKFFTATQIPGIEKRTFPRKLAGKLYKRDIPIFLEDDLPELIRKYKIQDVIFSYSDISHVDVMHKASIVLSAGANFVLLGYKDTVIKSRRKLVSVCAVRTGAGKGPTSRRVAEILKASGKKVVAIRHPMPYGDLWKQRCQRFADYSDLGKHECTIEEREEYVPWIKMGVPVYAGVDYKEILSHAEKEAEIIIWDGGNNDLSFYASDLHIVVTDPHRAGHEMLYHPGETNFRMADLLIINKIESAPPEGIEMLKRHIKQVNPKARVVKAKLDLQVSDRKLLKNKKALVVEDGPTLTHGEMGFGAGWLVAKRNGSRVISPKKYAIGSIKSTYNKYRHLSKILPAMGYGKKQIKELEKTINNVKSDVVVDATPVNLSKLIRINKPVVRVEYSLKEQGTGLRQALKGAGLI